MPPAPGQRGDACRAVPCAEPLVCEARLPGGYCASACGAEAACDGACIDTRDGQLCAKRCTSDRDCRTGEAYVCDRQWHACLVPNFAAPIARQCPTQSGRDLSFGDSEPLAIELPGGGLRAGVDAVLADDGSIVARVDARLARGRKGTLYALTDGDGAVQLATSGDRGASWTAPTAVHDPSDCDDGGCGDPLIASGTALHVLYATAERGLRVRTSRDGGTTLVTGPIVLAGTYGSALATPDGKLHVAAIRGNALGAYGSAQQVIEYAASSDGGTTFSAPVTISGRDELLPYFFSHPALAADPRRRWLYVAYVRGGRDATWEIVIAASKDSGATWTRTKLAGDGCAVHMVPQLALDAATGTLHVAYYDSEGAPGRFVHATCGPGATKCKVLGAINTVPFAGLSLSRHTDRSVGDYESLVLDDKRRVLHAVWAQPVDAAGHPVMRLFHATAKLKK